MNLQNGRMTASQSSLLVIDLQERLLPAIEMGPQVVENAIWLMQVAAQLSVPCVVTEQYPHGLGTSVDAINALTEDTQKVSKVHFSAVSNDCLYNTAVIERPQVVVCGTETHVCVLQSVVDLIELGKTVYVVEEAVGSRKSRDKVLGLTRMSNLGAQIVTREMVAFEWLERAGTDTFRQISKEFIR